MCIVHEISRDKVCPKSNPSEQPNTDNPTVNITEREEVDVPGTHNSTLSSMYSTDIKRGRQVNQGEDSDTMLMRNRSWNTGFNAHYAPKSMQAVQHCIFTKSKSTHSKNVHV